MKLSIIVPIYNISNKIHILLDSVLKSELDFEVICVNDGSTDDTLAVLESISDNRLIVLTKKNEGTFKTWQYGVKKSSGEYVTILDQDDYIDEDYIQFIFDFIENIKADVLFTPYYVEDENGNKRCEQLPLEEGLYEGSNLNRIRRRLISGMVPYGKFTKVISSKILKEQIENTYQGDVRDFEDWLTMIQVFGKINSLYISHKPFYHYIQHNNGNSVSKSTISYRKNYASLKNMMDFLTVSNYVKLDNNVLDMIYFYSSRIILNKCTKISEVSLADEILKNKRFNKCIRYSNIKLYEKIILLTRNAKLYILCYRIRKLFK